MILLFVILIIYMGLIISFFFGMRRIPTFQLSSAEKFTKFSIIIPIRNEANVLPTLLNSLNKLIYKPSHFEILFVDDDSTDESSNLIEKYAETSDLPIRLLVNIRSSASSKKDAIRLAIEESSYPWIITSDADCIFSKNWLHAYNQIIQEKDPALIIAPVICKPGSTFLANFQELDFLSLQGSTMGAFGINHPFLCNGANLAYSKAIFKELNPYNNNDHLASGDDIFLLKEMKNTYPKKIQYLKVVEATVQTGAETTFYNLLQQRVRWASKTSAVKDNLTSIIALVVLSMNFVFIIALSLLFTSYWESGAIIIISKILIDYALISTTAITLETSFSIVSYMLSAFCYPFFTIFVLFRSLAGGYIWKDRNYKK